MTPLRATLEAPPVQAERSVFTILLRSASRLTGDSQGIPQHLNLLQYSPEALSSPHELSSSCNPFYSTPQKCYPPPTLNSPASGSMVGTPMIQPREPPRAFFPQGRLSQQPIAEPAHTPRVTPLEISSHIPSPPSSALPHHVSLRRSGQSTQDPHRLARPRTPRPLHPARRHS